MSSPEESVAAWTAILAAVLTIIGLIRSETSLALLSAFFVASSVIATLYARRERLRVRAADIKIEGRSIDALNLANLRRTVNRTLVVQDVSRQVTIDGEDLKIVVAYSGYCKVKNETNVVFSVDTDSNTPFEGLDCWGFDLRHDPMMKHPIRPILRGSDGSSKKIAVPLLQPLTVRQPFKVMLRCALPGCMKSGIEYYAAALSFSQDRIPTSRVTLSFRRTAPDWVRAYDVTPSGTVHLARELKPTLDAARHCDYVDSVQEMAGQSTRVYVFHRPATHDLPQHRRESAVRA